MKIGGEMGILERLSQTEERESIDVASCNSRFKFT